MFKMIKNSLGMSGLYIVYGNAGAIYETSGKYGTSHLMEHLICKTFNHLRDELQANGISYNAVTSDEFVVVYCTGLSSRVEKYAQKIVDAVLGGIDAITETMFINERATVLQEYDDAFADPLECALLNGLRKVYGSYSPIGLKHDIENFTFEDFKKTYEEKFTKPTNIYYVGPNDIEITGVTYADSDTFVPTKQECIINDNIPLEDSPDTSRCSITVYGTKPVEKEDATAVFIGLEMLGRGLNSPLYQEIRENNGLSYYSLTAVEWHRDTGICIFGANTALDEPHIDENGNEVKSSCTRLLEIYDMILGNVEKYLTKERFDICLDMAKLAKEKRDVLKYQALEEFARDGMIDPLSGLDTITYEKVCEVLPKYINKDTIYKYIG